MWIGLVESPDSTIDKKASAKEVEKGPKTLGEKVWRVLNSSFGLWVLSSVVLAWITKAYSAREARKAESLKKSETARLLDIEIGYRLAMSLDGLRINEARLESEPTSPQGIYQSAYDYLDNYFLSYQGTYKGRDFSAYPQYRERTFRSLILELRTVVDEDEDDVADLKEALDAHGKLSDGADIGSKDPAPAACLKAFAEARELLQKRIVRARWRTMVDFLAVRQNAEEMRSSSQSRS